MSTTPGDGTGESAAALGAPASVMAGARVVGRLGEGTLAEVFRAVQGPLGRPVAIKVLKGSIATSSQLGRRFLREAELLARLAHQNIPQVYDAGEVEGRPFIVMELIEGISLHALLQKAGTLPADVATIVGLKLARALEYIHLRGIVHRDLKPSNVLVSNTGEVKLTDLGIAKDLSEDNDGLGVVGTPAYMSPEQVLGDKLDFRSDLFSFGIVLYEMLTGRRPFEEEPARTVMQKIRLDRYVPPRRIRRDVPAALECVLARCLEKNPAHRYTSTGALASDLGEHLAHAGIASHEARLISYLADAGVITRAEAQRALGPAATTWARQGERARARGFVLAQAAFGLLALGAMAFAEFGRARAGGGSVAALGPRPVGVTDVGFLRVVARPWAHVTIDGITVDTTPTAQPFRLAPGAHFVRLTNPQFVTEDRTVLIQRGATVWLDVDMVPAGAGARAER
jgi:serine/threonine-protein kinase